MEILEQRGHVDGETPQDPVKSEELEAWVAHRESALENVARA
jgi:hypothetical protein